MSRKTTTVFMGLLAGIAPALAVQTDTKGIHAVPTPAAVVVDGKLNDWDLSGETLMCYDVQALGGVYSGRVALMHDKENLYVSVQWKDATPMANIHDPNYAGDRGWAGDSLQLRLKTDRISHVTAWYHAAKQQPVVEITYGKSLDEPFDGGNKLLMRTDGWKLSEGAEMAFVADADGKGYVQELKLPWKLITSSKSYVAGDKFSMGVELLWGEADWPVHRYADNLADGASSREFFWTAHNNWGAVMLEPKGDLKLPEPQWQAALRKEAAAQELQGPVAISYELPADARVTLVVDDAQGKRVRNLVPALPRKRGVNTDKWDGRDDSGQAVAPGSYSYKGIYHDGIHLNYVMSFGNPGNPTWETSDGRGAFYGDHTPPVAVAAAGDYVALACPGSEAGKHLIGCDLKGQRLWGLSNRTSGGGSWTSLATDGKTLWVGHEDAKSYIYRVEIATGQYAPWKATAKDAEGREFPVLDLPVTDRAATAGDKGINLTSIALHDGVVAVALMQEDKILLLDSETGAVKKEIAVTQPRSVAFASDGRLMVLLADGRLQWVANNDGSLSDFSAERFADGVGLACDAGGKVYVSVRGQLQNVQVLSPEGKLVGEIGKRGGRPKNGAFDSGAMREPAQIALDSQGRLWVTETTFNPKRTSIWSTDGRLVQDLVGTTHYSAAGSINPYDPTMAYSDHTIYKIDLETGKWQAEYSIGTQDNPDDIFGAAGGSHVRFVVKDGKTLLYTTNRIGGMHCTALRDGNWLPAAYMGTIAATIDREVDVNVLHPLLKAHVGEVVAWADANGDGLAQGEEMTFAKNSGESAIRGDYWGQLPDTDGTVTYANKAANTLVKFPITGFSASGAPVYKVGQPQIVKINRDVKGKDSGMVAGGGDGRVYINQNPLTGIDKSGKVIFTYPSNHVSVHGSHTAMSARPGYLIGPLVITGIADMGGEIGEVFAMNGNLGEHYLFTSDGLWIQSVFRDLRRGFDVPQRAVRGESFDTTTGGGEGFGADFVRAKSGKVYLTHGSTDARVLEVSGLDSIKRFAGSFQYTPEQHAMAGQSTQQSSGQQQAAKSFTIAKTTQAVAIDGDAKEWPELMDEVAKVVEIQESAADRYGRVQARYDGENLYVAYRVINPRSQKMRNTGQDFRLLFKSGDAVDLMFGPSDPKGNQGNMRVLLSLLADKPIAVLYEKEVPGTPESARVPFASFWKIYFDRVTQVADVKMATGSLADGYFVEAAIPWKRLGVTPTSGLKVKGDFGMLFGDKGGTRTVSRQYWSNKATGLVDDIPGEADLTPARWGELTLE